MLHYFVELYDFTWPSGLSVVSCLISFLSKLVFQSSIFRCELLVSGRVLVVGFVFVSSKKRPFLSIDLFNPQLPAGMQTKRHVKNGDVGIPGC